MDFASIFTIISVIIAVSALILSIMIWSISKLDRDIKSLSNKIDGDIKSLANKIDSDSKMHSQRTDQLYMMFIDLLKNNNIKTNP